MKIVIVDTSLAVKWRLVEELSAEANYLRSHWKFTETRVVVPSWFSCEVANAFFQRRRKAFLTHEESLIHHRDLLMDVEMIEPYPALGHRAMEIAFETRQKASYDAFYLALAEHFRCELWTADERFWRAAYESFPFIKWLGNVVIVPPGN